MIILGLDSSTALASVCLAKDGVVLAEASSLRQRSHSEFLNQAIFDCLHKSELELAQVNVFAVSRGPGSFTGIRVAGNIAKTFSYALQKPLFVIDTLRLLALGACIKKPELLEQPGLNILSIINAYKNLVYYELSEIRQKHIHTVKNPSVCSIAELDSFIDKKTLVVGDGYQTYAPFFSPKLSHFIYRDLDLSDYPLASTLTVEAEKCNPASDYIKWNEFVPLYIRASEAEENLQRRNST